MTVEFKSGRQERLFDAVLGNLQQLGYRDELLQKHYGFIDWFQPDNPERIVPAAAFGQTPQSYDSACFAVLLSNGSSGEQLVTDSRALGAPYAFEVRDDFVINWRVGREIGAARELVRIQPDQLDHVFRDRRETWAGAHVLRSKGISFKLGPRQLDFIDLGLIPALEQQISSKLDRVLNEVVQQAVQLLERNRRGGRDDLRGLYRLVFRFLAGKVLHDRGIPPFRGFTNTTKRAQILDAVARHYGEGPPVPTDFELQDVVAANIWTQLDFRNLSVEVLAYIYENTFVVEEARRQLGTHGTPPSIAQYIVHHIPFDTLEAGRRQTLEPFCGHGVFLVAALQRLRELLPTTMDGKERHEYFVRMLRGFEIEEFAIEVGKLCLMLADFPNHDGWQLFVEDVFGSDRFAAAVRQSRVILSNPPFEDFSPSEKRNRGLSSVHKPAEFLSRVLANLAPDGMLGVVLPRQFLDGHGYRSVREQIYRRFQAVQLVALPDRVFPKSDLETVLLIASEPRSDCARKLSVSFVQVSESDRQRFVTEYVYSRRDEAQKTAGETQETLNVVRLRDVWDRLQAFPRLGENAEIHRGVEWRAPFDEQRFISSDPREGFQRGLYRAQHLVAFEPPEPVYLSVQAQHRRAAAFELRWDAPKVFVNAARVSRGPWAMVAFSDSSGLLSTQRFHGIWPQVPWTTHALAAVLNSPLANAFVAVHEFKRDIRIQTLKALPLPPWRVEDIVALDRLVADYLDTPPALRSGSIQSSEAASRKLLDIDAFVLRGYGLPPRIERALLDFLRGFHRPVRFDFGQYFPEGFAPTIPLWMYLSADYPKCSAAYFLSKLPEITDAPLIDALEEVSQ